MSENTMPKLVLPNEKVAETATAVAEAVQQEVVVKESAALTMESLTKEEQVMVQEFASRIDITDPTVMVQYGADSQNKVASFSDSLLNNLRTKDSGEAGELLSDLVSEIKGFDASAGEKKGFFTSMKKHISKLMSKYDKVNVNIDKITESLENHKRQLIKDSAMLENLYQSNNEYFKEITLYIIAGKEKLKEVEEKVLPELQAKAELSGDQFDLQALQDMRDFAQRFEKKLNDLKLTRTISIQMAPQIRILQHSNTLLADKIQSSIVNSIPLWKNQIIISMGLNNTKAALNTQKEVTDMTNELLVKNSEMLKQNTIAIAKENERAIVDIETLRTTNNNLITTITEVIKIQTEGAAKRAATEGELEAMELQLKDTMLNAVTGVPKAAK